jgi:hypothetical protein
MAILSKTGITTGQTVEPGHVTQSIDAFTGIEAYDISLSGSFNMTGSINGEPGVVNNLTSSYAITASYSLNGGLGNTFPFTGSALITGSLGITGSLNVSGSGVSFTTGIGNAISLNSPSITITDNTSVTSLSIQSNLTDDSIIVAGQGSEIDFGDAGVSSTTGYFRVPTERTSNGALKAGMMYWDDATSLLYIYSETLSIWVSASFV